MDEEVKRETIGDSDYLTSYTLQDQEGLCVTLMLSPKQKDILKAGLNKGKDITLWVAKIETFGLD